MIVPVRPELGLALATVIAWCQVIVLLVGALEDPDDD